MDTHSARVGRRIAHDLDITSVQDRTPEPLEVVYRNMLVGGVPGSGKSALFALLALHEVLSAEDSAPGNAAGGVEG